MMTIPKALSSGQAQTYHRLEYTSASQSYYRQSDSVKGEWQDNRLSIRLDSGKTVKFSSDEAQHLEYGYAVETAQHTSTDRVLLTGDASQLAAQRQMLTHLSPHIRDLAVYTSDSSAFTMEKTASGAEIGAALGEHLPKISGTSEPSLPEINLEELGISL